MIPDIRHPIVYNSYWLLEQENKDHNSQTARNRHTRHSGRLNHALPIAFIIRSTYIAWYVTKYSTYNQRNQGSSKEFSYAIQCSR
jgi:uncharacterized protein Veg